MTVLPKEIRGIGLSPIESQVMRVLCDGEAHPTKDLMIWDSQADENQLRFHIHRIRGKINGSRLRIHSGYEQGKLVYRLVMLLPSATNPL